MRDAKPSRVDGGCLCGKLRYTVVPRDTHKWDKSIDTCQCSFCRKVTGSLMSRHHNFFKDEVTFTSKDTLRDYQSMPGNNRGFCCECGSYLYFMRTASQYTNLAVGCFDPEDLKKWGPVLTKQATNLWVKDEIAGVTDHMAGERVQEE